MKRNLKNNIQMKEFLLYLLQAAICLSFFALVYLLFLRKQTFYLFNRIFLLGGLLIAFILPFIQLSYDVVLPQIPLGINYLEPNGLVDNSTEYFSIWLMRLCFKMENLSLFIELYLSTNDSKDPYFLSLIHSIIQIKKTD